MLNFAVFLVVVSIFSASLVILKEKAQSEKKDIEKVVEIEGIARSVDGKSMLGDYSFANITELEVRTGGSRVMVDYKGKVVVVNSIYSRGEKGEPI